MSDLSLSESLRQLLLPTFAKRYLQIARICEEEGQSNIEYLSRLTSEEIEHRLKSRIARLIKEAKLPRNKHLKDFEFDKIPTLSKSLVEELATGDFTSRYENILIFGNPGTGKTHLAIALSVNWCMQGRKVYYIPAAHLVQMLLSAKEELKLKQMIAKLDKYEILVIDDISYIPFDKSETDVLFQLLSDRYEMRSTVITSNLPFGKWSSLFKDEITTAAVIDRLVHHSTILELNGESYRIKAAKVRKKQATSESVNNESKAEDIMP
jgi:DNA replication protein DnaC